MSKSSWFPILASFVVIVTSILIVNPSEAIKKSPLPPPPISPPQTSPLLTAVPTPTITATDQDYMETYAKCGEIPYIQQYTSPRYFDGLSPVLWSPDCRFVAWSMTYQNSFGPWHLSADEGLFIYDLKTKKINRIYTPASELDNITFLKWQDGSHLIFHQNTTNSDQIYNLSTKDFYSL